MLSFAVFVSQNSFAFPSSSFPRSLSVSSAISMLKKTRAQSARRSLDSATSPLSFNFELSAINSLQLSPVTATLTEHLQSSENKTTLSLVFAILTSRVRPNPIVCHSYKKTPGVGSRRSNQNASTPFVTLRRQVCPFSSFSYNARPFAREVNR